MRERLPIALVLILAAVLLTSCRAVSVSPSLPGGTPVLIPPEQPPVETPISGKPLVVPGIPGLYQAWSSAVSAVPPTREPGDPLAPGSEILGVDCIGYLGSGGDVGVKGVWDSRSAIDWSVYDRCLEQAAGRRVKLPDGRSIAQPIILTLPSIYSDTGSRWYNTAGHGAPGTDDNPLLRLHLPPWMQNETYRFSFTAPSGQVYQSIRYEGEFKKRMLEFLAAAGKRYNRNPQVAAVRVNVGVQGESQPAVPCQSYWDVTPPQGADNLKCGGDSDVTVLAEHEKTVSCDGYKGFVRDLSEAALNAFPDKAVVSIADAGPCSGTTGKAFRKWLYQDQWAGKPIGLSMNDINIDRPDVDEQPGNVLADWNKWTVGRKLRDWGYPMLYEFDAHAPSVEGMYWTVLSAAANGGNFVLYHKDWNESFSVPMWDVVDYWLASERRAWLVFRDREYPTYDFDTGYGVSGTIGDWGKYLRLLNPEDAPQACSPALAKTARTANATAVADRRLNLTPACVELLPTPAITPAATSSPGRDLTNRLFDRQARRLDPRGVLRIAVSGDWPAFGAVLPASITVSYLDSGTDSFDVVLPGGNGRPARHTVRKTGSGIWKQVTWAENIVAGNLLDEDSFVQIINDAEGPEYLHEVYVTVPDGPYLPTPTATRTATATATPTFTPKPTLTPTATATASPTPTATATVERIVPASATPTATATATSTPSATSSPTGTSTLTATATTTATASPTATSTPRPATACEVRSLGALTIDGPRGLAAGTSGFYVALFDLSAVAGINGESRTVGWTRASGPGRTNGLALLGNTLVATNRDRGTVTLHNALTGEQLAIIAVGNLPWGVTASENAGGQPLAYVANFGSNSISVIDLANRRMLAAVPVNPMPVTAIVAEGQVYVLHLDGAVTVLDPAGKIVAQYKTGLPDTRGISFDPLRRHLYVGSQSGVMTALSLPDLTPVQRYALPGPVYAVAVNPGTGRIFAVDAQNDQLYVVEPDSGKVAQVRLPPQGDEEGGQGLVVWDNRVAVSNLPADSVSFFDDSVCSERLTATPAPVTASPTSIPAATQSPTRTRTPVPTSTSTTTLTPSRTPTRTSTPAATRTPTSSPTRTPVPTQTATSTRTPLPSPTPTTITVRSKVEIVWPHGGATVQDADLANVTAYLLNGDGQGGARTLLDSVPCGWAPTVRLWGALNNEPARFLGIGKKRMVTEGGRNYAAWDFNDVDVRQARDPANKLAFFVTVEDTGPVQSLHNVWTHAADARTLFPVQDVPSSVTRMRPQSVDAKIQIVWPQDNLPVREAQRANITAYVFVAGTQVALAPEIGTSSGWTPTVRLHTSLNNEPEAAPAEGILGTPRVVMGSNGVKFLAWDFNDVDISVANDPLNRLYFWLTVDGITTYSNVWAHAADARTLFPQPDVLNSCK